MQISQSMNLCSTFCDHETPCVTPSCPCKETSKACKDLRPHELSQKISVPFFPRPLGATTLLGSPSPMLSAGIWPGGFLTQQQPILLHCRPTGQPCALL